MDNGTFFHLRDIGRKNFPRDQLPAILSECGFYTNKQEVDFLLSNDGREAFANAHVEFMVETEAQA